ncbi:unnamed protein product [Didymodactylos carnosus]|uniref:Uncharacterized protein n=2 Tax=Didymodactylos carnosus TaxID=1234261 RepID=A0A8S2FUG4_9BILA|nr:unnamed protein product [Didymodactylos carnosus]CAF4357578.1 unnamed protein product [Didymodactylos carnosus]
MESLNPLRGNVQLDGASLLPVSTILQEIQTSFIYYAGKQNKTLDLSTESATFLWYQLILYVLQRMPCTKQTIALSIESLSEYYKPYTEQQAIRFAVFARYYSPNESLMRYMNNSYLSKIIRKALKTQDLNILFLCRFFIIDLSNQVNTKTSILKEDLPRHFHCMIKIDKTQIDRYKRNSNGHILTASGFLLAYTKIEDAQIFSRKNANNEYI